MVSHHLEVFYSTFTVYRLCVQIPHAGGRVWEDGDKKLLALARDLESLFFQFHNRRDTHQTC